MDRILPEDIALIKTISNVRFSPDGSHAAFVQTTPDREKNLYCGDIFVVSLSDKKVKQLTFSGNNSSYIWDDDETLLILTERKEEDKASALEEKTVFYRLSINGGEAQPAFSVSANVQSVHKVDAGIYAFRILTDWNRPDPSVVEKEICEEEKDYHIIEEVPAWGDGRGFVSGKRSALYIYYEKTKDLLRVTEKYTNVSSVDVRDGKILYSARTWQDLVPVKNALNMYDVKKKKNTVLLRQGILRISNAVFDNKNGVYFSASDLKQWGTGQLDKLYYLDCSARKYSCVFENKEEIAIGDLPMTDTFYGSSAGFLSRDGRLFFQALKGHQNSIYTLNDGSAEELVSLSGGINGFASDGKNFLFSGSEENGLNCLFFHDGNTEKLYDPNREFLKNKYVAKAEYVPFVNSDGYTVEGWVLKPIHYSSRKKYPALLEIHGGPRAAYGTAFFHEMQQYASQGYFVFFCNPRGSEGYGEEYADLRGKYGTIDYHDLMEFTDHVLKKYKQIDPLRIGCLGGSYGGFMCNWIEGHTDRFSAIASQRSVSNWVADFGSSEIGVTFDSNEMAATPWTDMEKMWEQSPLKYADQGKTPILFIHSREDYNCPIDQGMEMFTAMKYFHVPSRMVVFEQESHGLSRIGKPKHRIRRLREMNDWFEKYLSEN